jgi:hypothetical protein
MLYNIEVISSDAIQLIFVHRSMQLGPGLRNTLDSVLSRNWDFAVFQSHGRAIEIQA